MVEGVSGLLSVHRDDERPLFEPSKRRLTWKNGSVAELFSADEAEGLRGPQFSAAWCDELAKWQQAEHAWDMLQFALRLGLGDFFKGAARHVPATGRCGLVLFEWHTSVPPVSGDH